MKYCLRHATAPRPQDLISIFFFLFSCFQYSHIDNKTRKPSPQDLISIFFFLVFSIRSDQRHLRASCGVSSLNSSIFAIHLLFLCLRDQDRLNVVIKMCVSNTKTVYQGGSSHNIIGTNGHLTITHPNPPNENLTKTLNLFIKIFKVTTFRSQ